MTATSTAIRPFFVVPHTHWDREWYRPFEAYRFRLVETLDGLLAADLPYFLLDGQTVVLEDYLALRPEQREPIARRVREGRLGLGPWYIQADEFLVSGESLVRNLLEGRRTMAEFGATGAVGYLPDMFGHIGQMPQILRGFGLDHAVLWRGANPGASRFMWRSPDGTEITTAWLPQGYYQTMFLVELTREERLAQVKTYAESFAPDEPVFLLSGADHMAPRKDLMAMLDEVKESLPLEARVTPLLDAIRGPRPAASMEGELRKLGKPFAYILPGVLSTRTYLKQANVECQTLLERYTEPLTALAWAASGTYPTAFVRRAWKELLKNQPHDSICGCSIDQVHREMMPRFAAVRQLDRELTDRAVRAYPRPVASPSVFVFNPTGWAHEAWVEAVVHWPLEGAPEAIHLQLPDGRSLPTVTWMQQDTEVFRAEVDFNPDWFPVRRFYVAARVALPAAGGLVLKAVAGPGPEVATGTSAGPTFIENAQLRVEVVDGRVDLLDKATGVRYADCHYFLDEGDAGDEYNFSPLADDVPVRAVLQSVTPGEASAYRATLGLNFELTVPERLSRDRASRDAKRMITLYITSTLSLEADGRQVKVETRLDNQARDHRLRVVTTLGTGDEPAVWAEGTYGVFRREPKVMPPLPVERGQEADYPEFPQTGFTALERSDRSLAVFNQGLHEAQVFETAGGWALATTLLRAVGWLSRDDLRTRGGGAGPRFQTPEGQCEGPQVFHYALAPYQGGWTSILPLAHRFAAPPMAWEAEGTPFTGAAIALGNERLVLSALKKAEEAERLVLRIYNPTPEPVESTVEVKLTHRRVWEANLAEEAGEAVGTGAITARFRPYEIKTWLVELA